MARSISISDGIVERLAPWYGPLAGTVAVRRGSFCGWVVARFGQHAVTINGTVHWTRRAPDPVTPAGTALLGHELFHVVHQQEMGWWRFLAGYLWHWRPRHIRHGWEHPYEVEAYERQREIRQTLGI